MKEYIVPEIKITKFECENIVTELSSAKGVIGGLVDENVHVTEVTYASVIAKNE